MNFKPIRVVLRLMAPVVVTGFSPQLDGLLFEALRQRSPEDTDDQIVERLKLILSFNEDLKVFHASALKFGVTPMHGLVACEYNRIDRLHEEKRSSSMFKGNGAKGSYRKIVTVGGPTKKRLTYRPAYCAPYAVFDACGNAEQILQLLANTFVGIGYDAQNAGMGQFDENSIEIIQLKADSSLISNGIAMRSLPAGTVSGTTGETPLRPPYYSSERVLCNLAPRIQVINIETI